MQIISRAEAKSKKLRFYFSGRPCPHGHVAERSTFNCICVKCHKENAKARRLQRAALIQENAWLRAKIEALIGEGGGGRSPW